MRFSANNNFLVVMLLLLSLIADFVTAQSRVPQKKIATRSPEKTTQDKSEEATRAFEAAQDAHQKNELEEAVRLYQKALQLDSMLWQAEYQLSSALLALNRISDAQIAITNVISALTKAENAIELKPYLEKAYVSSAEIAYREGAFDKAKELYKLALIINSQDVRALSGLARVALQKNELPEAQNYAKQAIAGGDTSLEINALLGEVLLASGKANDALVYLSLALAQEVKPASILRMRARAYVQTRNLVKAIEDLKACLQLENAVSDKLFLAEIFSQSKSYDEAVQLYQQVLIEAPENLAAQTALTILLIDSGKSKDAITSLENLIKRLPERADLHAQLGALYIASASERALEEYQTAVKLNSSNMNYQLGAGISLMKLKRFAEAVGVLRRLLEQNPEGETAYVTHTNLATALFELDDFANAANEFIWILKQQKEQKRAAVTLYFLGICFDKLGDLEQALKVYNQFLSIASSENQLEIDKVKLRLPPLQRQLEKGQGKRKK